MKTQHSGAKNGGGLVKYTTFRYTSSDGYTQAYPQKNVLVCQPCSSKAYTLNIS